jgi:hypothetical protein
MPSALELAVTDHLGGLARRLAVRRLRRRRWRALLAVAFDPAEAWLAGIAGGLLGLAWGVGLGAHGALGLLLAAAGSIALLLAMASLSLTDAADRAVRRLEPHLSGPELLDAVDELAPVEVTALAGLRRT